VFLVRAGAGGDLRGRAGVESGVHFGTESAGEDEPDKDIVATEDGVVDRVGDLRSGVEVSPL
jgi:hypothetical protein